MSSDHLENMYHFYDSFFENEVRNLGDVITVEKLSEFDQYHYHGCDVVSEAAKFLKINEKSHVLDAGAGVGGPARYLAHITGCCVTGIEIQPEMVTQATKLNGRVELADRVRMFEGDLLKCDLGTGVYDAVMSFLVFLHIEDKHTVYTNLHRALKRGGSVFIEDYYLRGDLTAEEADMLHGVVACPSLPTKDEYSAVLVAAGFKNIKFTDMTKSWTKYTSERLKLFLAKHERHLKVHGADVTRAREHFLATVESLFKGGHLGGVRITAQKHTEVDVDAFPCPLPAHGLKNLVQTWMQEDIPSFDIGGAVVGTAPRSAVLKGKSLGVLAGVPFFNAVFKELNCEVQWLVEEGERFVPITKLAVVTGRACDILAGERTALNALTRASSVATRARFIKDKLVLAGWAGALAGTRKTTPGFRLVEKYAMLVGGADTHRHDLSSMVMLKDNHVNSVGSITAAVIKCKTMSGFHTKIEVECGKVEDALEALAAGADVVMLDNFAPANLHEAAAVVRAKYPKAIIEASGGISESTILLHAGKNIDVISLGALTQGVPSVDISLKLDIPATPKPTVAWS